MKISRTLNAPSLFFLFISLLTPLFCQGSHERAPSQLTERPRPLQPGIAGRDFTPVIVPNGKKAEYKIVDGIKVFHLTAEPLEWHMSPNLKVRAWSFNGSLPGPLIEAAEGDRVRIFVTNKLPAPTSIHWHGVILPCGMDGVFGITQPPILPGETFVYEFTFLHAGTFMYHSHFDDMTQEGMGLAGMIVVHKREPDAAKRPDRDFAILLQEWRIDVGAKTPDPFTMTEFNLFSMNGKVMPSTEPLVAKLGDNIWIRFGNLSAMDHHPIHLHGYKFKVIGTDGGFAQDKTNLLPETTVLVPTGSVKVIEFLADNPGDWIFHCHMTHHTMNQMGHQLPNMIGVEMKDLNARIQKIIPGYMEMGNLGMAPMPHMGMELPGNSIPMLGYKGQFGQTVMGGMGNILRVRENISSDEDPGPYEFPKGSVAWKASPEELKLNGISED